MSQLTTYRQMTASPTALFEVMKREIGEKSTSVPFATKMIEALKSLGTLTEQSALKAANVFLSDWQTLKNAGITVDDYDLIYPVKRGGVITLSVNVRGLLRAAARKGYRINLTFISVPKEDGETTYFKENFYNGEIVYTIEDLRKNGDREITPQRLIDGYFNKFMCRIEISEIKTNTRIISNFCEMSNDEVMKAQAASDNGIFKSEWITVKNGRYEKKQKRIYDGKDGRELRINDTSIWAVWTAQMVEKTVVRRALKNIREVLPELKETIYAFDKDDVYETPPPVEIPVEIPVETVNVDLENLTESQKEDVAEMFELFKANPKLATDKANEVMEMWNTGKSLQEIINVHYATIENIKKSKKNYPIIKPIFEGEPEPTDNKLLCTICGYEIKNKNSIAFYAKNPNKPVKCYKCEKEGA